MEARDGWIGWRTNLRTHHTENGSCLSLSLQGPSQLTTHCELAIAAAAMGVQSSRAASRIVASAWCLVAVAASSAAASVMSTTPLSVVALEARLTAAAGVPVACGQNLEAPEAKTYVCGPAAGAAFVPRVTVFSTLFRISDEMVEAWLNDISRQTIVHQVELAVALVDDEYSDVTVDMLGIAMGEASRADTHAFGQLGQLRVVWFPSDIGLYATWSYLVLHTAHPASYRTNWNPDDRRAPYALARQAAVLDAMPWVDLVSGPVRQITRDPLNASWNTTHDSPVLQLVSASRGRLPRQLTLADFGRIIKGQFQVINPPHNAPLFRRRVTDVAGGAFDMALDPLSDWALWVRAIQRGCIFWHIESPLILWYRGPRQYSATHAEKRASAVDHVLKADCSAWERVMGRDVCSLTALQRETAAAQNAESGSP